MFNKNYQLLKDIFQLEEEVITRIDKKGFIAAFCKMDITKLGLILRDNKTYQDTSKSIFIEKLAELFKEYKTKDTELLAYNGVCCSNRCDNTGKKGVLFIGNNSGRYTQLIIEESKEGFVNDVYFCYDFCANNKIVDETKEIIDIYIPISDRIFSKDSK